MFNVIDYDKAISNLRGLLASIGRHEFRASGYAKQLREYRNARFAAAA